jgi:hypothetical protein
LISHGLSFNRLAFFKKRKESHKKGIIANLFLSLTYDFRFDSGIYCRKTRGMGGTSRVNQRTNCAIGAEEEAEK